MLSSHLDNNQIHCMTMKKGLKTFLKFSAISMTPFLMSLLWFHIKISFEDTSNTGKYPVRDSSVWCREDGINSKLCKFKNVCYHPDTMSVLFFLGNLSVIKGLSNYKEFQTIQLSSVSSHNKFEANLSVVNVNHEIVINCNYIRRGLMFSRFKPDNIMHVIHDDLIPLFLTLEDICLGDATCQESYRLVFHDPYPKSAFHNLYAIFSVQEPLLLSNVSETLCFEELHMGLVKDGVFYDYGFDKPQGPVQNTKLHPSDLLRFSSFVKRKLGIEPEEEDGKDGIVLVSRRKTRKILNEDKMISMLEDVFKTRSSRVVAVSCLDLRENDTYSFIKEASKASAFVGMHGAEMIFAVFLKANATVVELFPYAIKPHVSFIKPLSNIKGINFDYIHWENTNKTNSVSHPDADPLHGGIGHLPTDTQENIKNVREVPPVRCCNDPVYLHYMYQDTIVDSGFQNFLTEKLRETRRKKGSGSEWFYPYSVTRMSCSYDPTTRSVNLNWSAPFNVRSDQVYYDVFVQCGNIQKSVVTEGTNFALHLTHMDVSTHTQNGPEWKIQTWITSVMKTTKTKSKDVLIECSIS